MLEMNSVCAFKGVENLSRVFSIPEANGWPDLRL